MPAECIESQVRQQDGAARPPRFPGKRAAMLTFSPFPADPRPRRAVHALLSEGMTVDLICLADDTSPRREQTGGLRILRLPIRHRRGGKLAYAYTYSSFIFLSALILALRTLRRRYDLVHVHNMPDILVSGALVPKLFGAKVLLDLHDPMPELMTTIFHLDKDSRGVRLIRYLEKWSIARSDRVVTVNLACKRIFGARSCAAEKVGVVMNAPDERIFPFRDARSYPRRTGGRFVIMYHGSLVERNGLELAVAALRQLRPDVPGCELRVFGNRTPFLDRVLEKVREEGLTECVHYLGPRRLEDLAAEIENCDVGIVPNLRSAFTDINTPTRLFEYLALGKPVVAPGTPGIQDYFNPQSLVFFESGNAGDLAGKLRVVAFHPDEAVETAHQGQKVYLAHRWSQEKETFVELVSGVLQTGGAQ